MQGDPAGGPQWERRCPSRTTREDLSPFTLEFVPRSAGRSLAADSLALRIMKLAELTPERRREVAEHPASDMYSPDGLIQIELGRSEAGALVDLLELLAVRPADDPTGAEGSLALTGSPANRCAATNTTTPVR